MFFYINLAFNPFLNNKKYISLLKKCLKTLLSGVLRAITDQFFVEKYLLIRISSAWNLTWMFALKLKMRGFFSKHCTQPVYNLLLKIVNSFLQRQYLPNHTYPQYCVFTRLCVSECWLKRYFQHLHHLYSLLFHILILKIQGMRTQWFPWQTTPLIHNL